MDPLAALALSPTAFTYAVTMAITAGLIRGFTGFGATDPRPIVESGHDTPRRPSPSPS